MVGQKEKGWDLLCVLVAQSCLTLRNPTECSGRHLESPWDSPGKNTGVGSHFLLQGIFPTQGSNPDLPYCRQILYCLSHQGSHRISYSKTFLTTSLWNFPNWKVDEPWFFSILPPWFSFHFQSRPCPHLLLEKWETSGHLVAQVCDCNSSQLLCDKAAWTQKATLVISC